MLYYILAVSFITFILWGIDKSRAINDHWRIPEKWLFALIIIGGALGALLGMVTFRHKTKKTIFWVVAIIACLAQAVLLFWLVYLPGSLGSQAPGSFNSKNLVLMARSP